MAHESDDAIVLRTWDFSETSQTVALFCRRLGLLRGLAKGSKRPKSPYSGGFEVLTLGEATAITKSAPALATITEWDLREVFWSARRSLDAHRASVYAIDLVYHLIHELDPHPTMFDALVRALREMTSRPPIDALIDLQLVALRDAGFAPQFAPEHAAPTNGTLGFDPARGRVVDDPGRHGIDGVWRVRSTTIERLRAPAHADHNASSSLRAAALLATYAAHVIGREPPAQHALFGRDAGTHGMR